MEPLSPTWVPVQVGSLIYAIPEMTAALLEDNLRSVREWDDHYGDAATSAADRIRRFRDGESSAPVEFQDDERTIIGKLIGDGLIASPHDSPTLRAILSGL